MKPLVLCILDGVGIREEIKGNAVKKAKMPTLNYLLENYPNSLLEASGTSVGLPNNQMGNSEVGHMNIGAGRIVYQPLMRITKSIEDKSFFENKKLLDAINHSKSNNSKLHIMGLLSDGGVHSHIDHLMALIDMCKQNNVNNVYYHLFIDGRDTLTNVAYTFVKELENKIHKTGVGKIASISGRYYSMDRDNNWDRIKKSYDVIVNGKNLINISIKNYIEDSYKNGITDEFIEPALINKNGLIEDNDSIIVFNFRPDRLRELFTVITNKKFDKFEQKDFNNIKLVTMMPVSDEVICSNAFDLENLNNTLGDYLSSLNYTQLRIAETEKYAHVTYFFDGGVDKDIKGCKRILIPSKKVATYDLEPQMSAYEITDNLLKELDKDLYNLIVVNYANGDMVGHTGNFDATVKALESVDECLKKLYDKIEELDGTLVLTADHGNSDYMIDENDNPVTSHSTSLVPFLITDKNLKLKNGKLADIGPTILKLLDLEIPKEMTGNILIEE